MSAITSSLYIAYLSGVFLLLALNVATVFARKLRPGGRWLTAAVVVVGTAGLVARSAQSGHLPIFGTFENTYTASWFLLAAAALASLRIEGWKNSWRLASPWAAALLLLGRTFRSDPIPLTISEQSFWVDIHVLFAWLALVGLLGATTLSTMRLAGRLPEGWTAEQADERITSLLWGGFIAFTVMLAIGSYYEWVLFGTFWSWDIVETICLVAWLAYGLIIHFRLFYRWGGRKLDGALVAVLPVLLAGYFIWSFWPSTFHFFDVPLVRPY